MSVITVRSKAHEQVVDITADVAALAASMGDGVCSLFTRHTTCALTVLTNEEGIAEDFLSVLFQLGAVIQPGTAPEATPAAAACRLAISICSGRPPASTNRTSGRDASTCRAAAKSRSSP